MKIVAKKKAAPKRQRPKACHPDREGQFWKLWEAFGSDGDKKSVFGLLMPETQFRFHPVRKWKFDFAWPAHLLAVEIEGGFASSRSGHRSISGFLGDIEKYNEAAALGWCLLRFTAKDLDDKPMQTVEFVRLVAERIRQNRDSVLSTDHTEITDRNL